MATDSGTMSTGKQVPRRQDRLLLKKFERPFSAGSRAHLNKIKCGKTISTSKLSSPLKIAGLLGALL